MQVSRHRTSPLSLLITFLLVVSLAACSTRQTVYPAQFLGLRDWKLSVPVVDIDDGAPTEIGDPALKTYQSEFFHLSDDRKSVVFRTPVDGAIQPGSEFPRTELREITDTGQAAAWSNIEGSHSMTIRQAITAAPALRPSLVAGQIHNDKQYIMLAVLDGARLYVKADDRVIGELDDDYRLGTVFNLRFDAHEGRIRVYYNNDLKVDYEKTCESCYFKAGCYLQANPRSGNGEDGEDGPDVSGLDFGEVRVRDLVVRHTDGKG